MREFEPGFFYGEHEPYEVKELELSPGQKYCGGCVRIWFTAFDFWESEYEAGEVVWYVYRVTGKAHLFSWDDVHRGGSKCRSVLFGSSLYSELAVNRPIIPPKNLRE